MISHGITHSYKTLVFSHFHHAVCLVEFPSSGGSSWRSLLLIRRSDVVVFKTWPPVAIHPFFFEAPLFTNNGNKQIPRCPLLNQLPKMNLTIKVVLARYSCNKGQIKPAGNVADASMTRRVDLKGSLGSMALAEIYLTIFLMPCTFCHLIPLKVPIPLKSTL
ncbi:hypothetical protein B0T21DRAFT_78144 [Apiosordaria backusii]|uniref:Uncharacterized protein n=1 Tax=Apiosordaria backusii TaxID=314023 RepID=A0AA40A7B0_9PEZI|nr:hypothetical protein B0T21DRAFT_78144 [Apiosordaria backusii]